MEIRKKIEETKDGGRTLEQVLLGKKVFSIGGIKVE